MSNPAGPRLAVRGLYKDYALGTEPVRVLSGLDLQVDPAEMVAIMGPSGAGKTTLLNCIAGIDDSDAGQIEVAGMSMHGRPEARRTHVRREAIGMVFQFFNLIPTLNVRENVALPLQILRRPAADTADRVEAMIERVGLKKRADHFPFQLSGGEMQLVSIARALVHEPPLLLADEPTGNVNPAAGRRIMDLLITLTREQGTSVVMVTHSPEHAAWADRICFLKDGVISSEYRHPEPGRHEPDDLKHIYDRLLELEI
ncbi:MAG: ABC transporter ATP-binding protein [Gammaproteobacteria bacterium]|nr:ABC transporter ATP-binding protein [Gammaproteobacteria bacterium]MCP5137131.1 ABC transporter ATP-binding protein [Gammaproteobacteria bacterium]